jgi:hypothetical protein
METARRILVIVYPTSPLFAISSINAIFEEAFTKLQARTEDARILYLSTWPSRTLMVFDLNNSNYDFANAHKPQDIPGTAIHMRAATRVDVKEISGDLRSKTNTDIAEFHRLHGYSASLPLIDDHRKGNVPSYPNPRDIKS